MKRHLKPGGVVTQWVPLYESTIEVVKSEMATFFAVFPDGIVWINDRESGGDVVLFGQVDPTPINVDEVVERFDRIENARAAKSVRDVGFVSAIDLLSSYAGRGWWALLSCLNCKGTQLEKLERLSSQRNSDGPQG